MDFSVPQKGNTRFMYILPFDRNFALVEYTLFSKKTLEKEEYEYNIKQYLEDKNAGEFKIVEKEAGSIPMTGITFQNTIIQLSFILEHLVDGQKQVRIYF